MVKARRFHVSQGRDTLLDQLPFSTCPLEEPKVVARSAAWHLGYYAHISVSATGRRNNWFSSLLLDEFRDGLRFLCRQHFAPAAATQQERANNAENEDAM